MYSVETFAELIQRHSLGPGISETEIPRLTMVRADNVQETVPAVYAASICLMGQGAKRVSLGGQSFVYDQARYLIISMDMPLTGEVLEASPEKPYLCCKIDLNMRMLADLVAAEPAGLTGDTTPAVGVYPNDPDLIDAACRMIRLLDKPESIRTLAPLIEREILYRLLVGPHGGTLRQIATGDSRLNQLSRAIAMIRAGFRDSLRVTEIAEEAGMSVSSLHTHFKAMTLMTPLEFQKNLRLQEARSLMLSGQANAGAAGFAVGYESQSQFTREYRRMFGAPPKQDIERLGLDGGVVAA